MKKLISILLTAILCISTITAFAADTDATIKLQINNPVMTVNGANASIDSNGTTPVIINERTLVPVRAIIEALGGTVSWEQSTQTATLNYGDDEIKLIIDSVTAYLNDTPNTLDTAPTTINERTMLPLRFIAESFKFNVDWEQSTQTVTITKPSQSVETTIPTTTPSTSPIPQETNSPSENIESKTLVVYFSNTGNTEKIAESIVSGIGADVYEIEAEEPYTSADLNYNTDCRANREQNNISARPKIGNLPLNIDEYDTIYLGYPIWWGQAPKIIYTFLESFDFTGKTIIPFCTSGSSSIGTSDDNLRSSTNGAKWIDGRRFSGSESLNDITAWATEVAK